MAQNDLLAALEGFEMFEDVGIDTSCTDTNVRRAETLLEAAHSASGNDTNDRDYEGFADDQVENTSFGHYAEYNSAISDKSCCIGCFWRKKIRTQSSISQSWR